jgi:hypothetical protein
VKVTLPQYYRGFLSLYGALAPIPFVPPLIHILTPDSGRFACLYPPLGDMQILPLAATSLVLFTATLVVYVSCKAARKIHPAVCPASIVGALLSFFLLIGMYVSFVRDIAVPSVNQEVLVSIGYQRTDFALKTYPTSSDWSMLHDQGPSEESIQTLWTRHSIWIVRGILWLLYTVTLACFLVVICVGVYQHASAVPLAPEIEGPQNPKEGVL